MAGCGPGKDPRRKGRCKRCPYSQEVKQQLKDKTYRTILHCTIYDNLCQCVAWNCPRVF